MLMKTTKSTDVANPPIIPGTQHRNKAIVINIFGGPGAGKTMMASRLFTALKSHHMEVANPEEYAKRAVWRGEGHLLDEQLILAGQIWKSLFETRNAVDIIILDSPLLLAAIYGKDKEDEHFAKAIASFHQKDTRLNILLKRMTASHYDTRGRRENEFEATQIDVAVQNKLQELQEPYLECNNLEDTAQTLAKALAEWTTKDRLV